jgi:hypothetical protein
MGVMKRIQFTIINQPITKAPTKAPTTAPTVDCKIPKVCEYLRLCYCFSLSRLPFSTLLMLLTVYNGNSLLIDLGRHLRPISPLLL